MIETEDVLPERLRSTFQAVTSSTVYRQPPPLDRMSTTRSGSRPALRIAGALVLVLVLAVGVAVLTNAGTDRRTDPALVPVDQQALFPDVAPPQGPELLLVPGYVPDSYNLLYAAGPDPARPGTSHGGSVNSTVQTWVKLDDTGRRPLAGFTIDWGPQDLADTQSPNGPRIGHQDALSAYDDGEPITVDGHRGIWSQHLETVAWVDADRAIRISAAQDNWTGTWPEHLTRAELEAMAGAVVAALTGRTNSQPRPATFASPQRALASRARGRASDDSCTATGRDTASPSNSSTTPKILPASRSA